MRANTTVDGALWAPRDGFETVQMRVGAAVTDARADALTLALCRAAAARLDHVERLVDLGFAASGDLVLVTEATPHSLGELLAAPGEPALGEVVTILAPLVEATRRLHAAGVAHGRIDADAVRFDAAGSPVLRGFGAAVLADQVDGARFAACCTADRGALGRLAVGVLRRAGLDDEQADRLTAGWDEDATFATAADAIFDLAEPEPVRFGRRPIAGGPPTRLIAPASSAAIETKTARPNTMEGPIGRIRAVLRPVRARVWIAAGSGFATLVAALILLPAGGR
jgi:eukaryotic-like serine/threonine-protein kinase